MGQTWAMELPMGVADPMFLHELALELGKSVEEIGTCMSANELTVQWPAFFAARARERERQADQQRRMK